MRSVKPFMIRKFSLGTDETPEAWSKPHLLIKGNVHREDWFMTSSFITFVATIRPYLTIHGISNTLCVKSDKKFINQSFNGLSPATPGQYFSTFYTQRQGAM